MMQCKQCGSRLEASKGNKPRLFCSDKCRKAFKRTIQTDTYKVHPDKRTDVLETDTICDATNGLPEQPTITIPTTALERMAAKGKVAYRDDAPAWKYTEEYAALIDRMETASLDQLTAEGFWIPAWRTQDDEAPESVWPCLPAASEPMAVKATAICMETTNA